MKIHQYAHFDVASDVYDPDAITAALLIEPTKVSWKESKSTDPPIPRSHLWQYRAKGDGSVDDLVRELLGVFIPLRTSIAELRTDGACRVEIRFMRSFGDPDGEEEDAGPEDLPSNLVRLPGQHQLLGFHLDTELMSQLVSLGCSLDFDEYG